MSSNVEREKAWLRDNVHCFLKPMLLSLLRHKPEDPADAMIEWLEDYRYDPTTHPRTPPSENSESEVLDLDELAARRNNGKKKLAISAEAYGEYNRLGEFTPRVVEKSPEQLHQIESVLQKSFMFAGLEEKAREVVIAAMEVKEVAPGEPVIRQGDDGNELYIVSIGRLRCFKGLPEEENTRFLCSYSPGGVFGELSLLYSTPRAASVVAEEQSVLFCLDRNTFNHIVKSASIRRRERYDDFINRVEIFQELDPYERGKLCDVLDVVKFPRGEFVVREGEVGDRFFLIEEGTAVALKKNSDGEMEEVLSYGPNDYFGELALLGDGTRQASIRVTSEECVLAFITIETFKGLVGPIGAILQRNAEKYLKYTSA